MSVEIRLLGAADGAVLNNVDEDVFDDPIIPESAATFLESPLHHIAVALDDDRVIGFASGVHYFHPDKPSPELFINEVGVAESHQGRGIAKRLLATLIDSGRSAGCKQAWVLTNRDNVAAMKLYAAAGGVESENDAVMFSFALD